MGPTWRKCTCSFEKGTQQAVPEMWGSETIDNLETRLLSGHVASSHYELPAVAISDSSTVESCYTMTMLRENLY